MNTSAPARLAETAQDRWNDRLDQLAAVKASGKTISGPLYSWLRAQRRQQAAGTLSGDRKAALDVHAPGWEGRDAGQQWRDRAEDLANYVDLAGHLPSTAAGAEPASLYRWMQYQRTRLRAGKLARQRIKWLNKNVPGWMPADNNNGGGGHEGR